MYQYSRAIILLLGLLIVSVSADVNVRTGNIENNSISSNVPYSFHYKQFQSANIKMFEDEDLSQFGGMSLFVGYGLSDKKEQNCYFVNFDENKNILNDFESPMVLGAKSYAISRAKMTYGVCKSLVAKYAGYIYSPFSATTDTEVKKRVYDKKFWIGLTKSNCSDSWKNDYGIEQNYNKVSSSICDVERLNISSSVNEFSWQLSSKSESNYCLMQIDSKDYLRPIKVCAPWWQIEQSYSIDCEKKIKNLTPFMNIIVPKKVSYCADTDISSELVDYESRYANRSLWQTTTCSGYYSIKAGESCKEDMLQDQCYVNECAGSIEKRCQLRGSASSLIKDYELSSVVNSVGIISRKKVKDKIEVFEYLCPPPRPSIAGCLNYKTINILPTDECQPGGCDTYFNCLNEHVNNYSACDDLKDGCERRYGHDLHRSANGDVDYAIVKCNDGSYINNYNINKISDSKSKCTKYSTSVRYENKNEQCVIEKAHSEFSIQTSITESDIYIEDEDCIRINNESAFIQNKYYLEFESSKYFKTKISKVSAVLSQDEIDGDIDYANIVAVLDDGSYSMKTYTDGNITSDLTLAELSNVFANSSSIIVGSDSKTQEILNTQTVSSEIQSAQTQTVEYDYFKQSWWNSRMFIFDSPELMSITRPYSSFAKCLDIPLDEQASSYGTPVISYSDGVPVVGAEILREDYESSYFMNNLSDSDAQQNGFYCKRGDSASYINWYGDADNELYYNEYSCSYLLDQNGEVWAQPTSVEIKYEHEPFEINGTATVKTANIVDYARGIAVEHSTTVEDYKALDVSYNSCSYEAYYYSNSVESGTITPGSSKVVRWYTTISADANCNFTVNSNTTSGGYIPYNTNGVSTVSPSSSVSHEMGWTNYYQDYTLYVKNTSTQGASSCNDGYAVDSGKCKKTVVYKFYEYTCEDGYTPVNSGFSTHSKTDPNSNIRNDSDLDNNVNSATPPSQNCVRSETYSYVDLLTCPDNYTPKYSDVSSQVLTDPNLDDYNRSIFDSLNIVGLSSKLCVSEQEDVINAEIDANLTDIKAFEGGGYCVKTSEPIASSDGTYHYADYNCSKYLTSTGEWDYQYEKFYLYSATNYKYFRKDSCGVDGGNINNIAKDGSNAMMLDILPDTTAAGFIANIESLSIASDLELHADSNESYQIPTNKVLLAEETTVGSIRVIDKTITDMDRLFELFKHDGKIRLLSISKMSEQNCVKYKEDLEKSKYKVEYKTSNSKCIIDFDYFNGVYAEEYVSPEVVIDIKEGSFDFNQTGTSEILTVESYVDGEWGYVSNHVTKPFADATVKINGKQIFPILGIKDELITKGELSYKRYIWQKGTISRRQIVPSPSSSSSLLVTAALGWGTLGVVDAGAYIINLFGGKKRYTDVNRNYELYFDRSKFRYFENVYGLDKRIDQNPKMLVYKNNYVSGTREKNAGEAQERKYYTKTKELIVGEMGVDEASFNKVQASADKSFIAGYPDLEWYQTGPKTDTWSGSYNSEVDKYFNMVFYGATNTITLFVPFKGDYEIVALDKNSNILGKKTIYSENYETDSDKQAYQQVFFATDEHFDLADGIEDANIAGACRYSNVVEWGGGVSGAYYSFGTSDDMTCDKSNDAYVKEHAAAFLSIRPLGSTRVSIVKLKHPMPYANRVFVSTMSNLETREYSCYQDADCEIEK